MVNKNIDIILFIAHQLKKEGIEADFHKVFKILYFAEKKHLSKYGRTISNDTFIAKRNGPVPSRIYDDLKKARVFNKKYKGIIKVVDSYYIEPIASVDMDDFSESEIEVLMESVKENKNLSFNELKEKSHDEAWKQSDRNDNIDYKIMSASEGANAEMLKYINLTFENKKFASLI